MIVKAGSTDVTTYFVIRTAADGTATTGATITSIDLQYTRSGVAPTAKVDATALAATDSAHADNKAIEIDATDQPGLYRVDWPDAAFAAGVGEVVLSVKLASSFTEHLRVELDPSVNVAAISDDQTAADNLESACDNYSATRGLTGTALPAVAADGAGGVPISDAGGLDLDAQVKTAIDLLVTGTPTTKYMGQFGPGVYVDSGAGNTNTVVGTDGTVDTPVSTFAAARTIADAIGLNRYYIEGNSDITLAATHADWEVVGVGAVADNVVNLGSQDVSRSRFYNLTLEGTQGGASRMEAIECALQDPGAGATTLHIFALRCGLVDDIEIDTSNNNVFESCYSLVAGATTPSITATGAAGTLEIRHYSGGIELKTLSASHNVSIEGMGQVVFNADCNVNANVSIRGLFTITDNTAGMASLTQDAVVNMPKINTEADTALSDIKLDHLLAVADGDDVADDSVIGQLASTDGDWSNFAKATDSLQAIRDRGDAAWITGGGGGITDILNVVPLVPNAIDLADTATLRLGLMLTNALDDLPSTAEITPGTISIDRKASGGTSWTNIVSDAACSEAAGLVYYDEVFDTGTGYAVGDSIRVTFKSQKITVAANDYEITDATGRLFYTYIRRDLAIIDALTGALAEVGAVPAANASMQAKVNWIFALCRNKVTETAALQILYNDGGAAPMATAVIADDGTTLTRNEFS